MSPRFRTLHLNESSFGPVSFGQSMTTRSSSVKRRDRTGFTMIEVIVALTLSAIVLVSARAMLGALDGNASRIRQAAATADKAANIEETFRRLIGLTEVGPQVQAPFAGDSRSVTFGTWCEVPSGWLERCETLIRFEKRRGVLQLVIRSSVGSSFVLRDSLRYGELRYLTSADNGGIWLSTWGPGVTSPLAIGVILDADTLMIPIGDRG
jgi:prepilin-type N-terminal cleavage/methylation domain-containing protein